MVLKELNESFIKKLFEENFISEREREYYFKNIKRLNRFNLKRINRTLVKDCSYCPFEDYCLICSGTVEIMDYIILNDIENNKDFWWYK